MISFWKPASAVGLPDVQDAREEMIQHQRAYVPDTCGLCSLFCFLGTAVLQEHIFNLDVL